MVFLSPSPRLPGYFILCLGLFLGWGLAHIRPAPLRAAGGDRSGESIVATGPVMVKYDEGNKVQIPLEALYLLDYKGGRLMGTVPSIHQTVGATRTLGTFAERDLVADFKLDLDNGPKPHFLIPDIDFAVFVFAQMPFPVLERRVLNSRMDLLLVWARAEMHDCIV